MWTKDIIEATKKQNCRLKVKTPALTERSGLEVVGHHPAPFEISQRHTYELKEQLHEVIAML